MYLNKALIAGNLTRDPEIKALPSGVKVCNFSLATNRYWRDKDSGERKEMTEYHNIVVFGRQAELCGQYLVKGKNALVEGRLQTRSWEGTDGQKKYRTEVVADSVQFGSQGGGTSAPQQKVAGATHPGASQQETPQIDYPEDDTSPEDIPF